MIAASCRHLHRTGELGGYHKEVRSKKTSKAVYKTIPTGAANIFPVPITDYSDILNVGVRYQSRWFASEVAVPGGGLGWIDRQILRPYAAELVDALGVSGFPCKLLICNGRYVIDGETLQSPPPRVCLPGCRPLNLDAFLLGMEKALAPATADNILFWIEFLGPHLGDRLEKALKPRPRLRDLMR